MFSTTPISGTLTWPNIAMPRRASISARSCGVETITAPASGTFWAMVSCVSPVPGGMSTTSTSSSPHTTSRRSWFERRDHHRAAPDDRGALLDQEADRHHLDAATFERNELLPVRREARLGARSRTAWASTARTGRRRERRPSSPSLARPTARLQATVDLPTPPLPEATAMMCLTPGIGSLDRPCRRGRRIGLMTMRRRGAGDVARRFRRQRHHRAGDAGNRLDRGLGRGAHRLHRLRPRRIDGDGDEHLAVANGHAGDRPEFGQGRAAVGAGNRRQRRHHLVAGNHGSQSFSLAAAERSSPAEGDDSARRPPIELVAQRHDRPDDDDGRPAQFRLARLRRQRSERADDDALRGAGRVVDDRRRQGGVRAMRDELARQRLQVAQPHIDRNRLARLQERPPIERDLAVLAVAGHEHAGLGVVAMGERNAGIGRGPGRRGDARTDLKRNSRPRRGLRFPRRRGRT